MAELRVRSPAKINLHLEVLGLRPDGFHELAMVMQTIELVDELRLAPTADGRISLHCDHPDLPTDSSNLIVRAAELLRARCGLPELGAMIHLSKQIPIGAGLAGGSSNGAASLVGLNELWGLGYTPGMLEAMAAELGSDMPYCLVGGTQLCFGRGERLEPLPAVGHGEPPGGRDLDSMAVLLLKHPAASVSTPWAYRRCRELREEGYLHTEQAFEQRRQALRQGPLVRALAEGGPLPALRNDLQAVVEPEVASVGIGLALLRRLDAPLAVAMSGSGPSLFALFADLGQAQAAREQLAAELEGAGFHSWACSLRPGGAMLEG
jgi:4-diphosphocytidyl-2-C-methyl-D-erythritol kinase